MGKPKKNRIRLWAAAVWLLLWQAAGMVLDRAILLPSPLAVLRRLTQLAATANFWASLGLTAGRILGGFLLSCCLAVVLAALSASFSRVGELLAPLVAVVKAVPVASFIILVFLWVPSRYLTTFISALMVFPPVYLNLLEGIARRDLQLLEMARVFRIPWWRRMWGIDLPQVLPYFRAACSLGLGLCWKAGIASEVIGVVRGSLGEQLYESKIYFEMTDLFAWTVTIVVASALFEWLFLRGIDALMGKGAA